MAKPAEVQLGPGWLEDDVRRAQSRLNEWSAASLHVAGGSPQTRGGTPALSPQQESSAQAMGRSGPANQ